MPYNSLSELPEAVKKLPKHAQEIWMKAFNSAYEQYQDESKAFAVAWAAVKKAGYKSTENIRLFNIRQVSKCKAYIDKATGDKYIEVPVSGVRKDRDGDQFGYKAGNSMIKAYKSGTIPMFSNHGLDEHGNKSYRWEDILGKFVDAWWADNKLDIWAKAKLNPHNPKADLLFKYIQSGMPVGFSIGGDINKSFLIKSVDIEKDFYDDIVLLETSPVGIPAYPYAVNKSFSEQLKEHIKKERVTALEEERKRRGMSVEEFYAAPRDPPSASALPIFDAAHVRNAMARFNQTHFLSEEEKERARRKIIAAARKFGIDIREFEKVKSYVIKEEGGGNVSEEKENVVAQEGDEEPKEPVAAEEKKEEPKEPKAIEEKREVDVVSAEQSKSTLTAEDVMKIVSNAIKEAINDLMPKLKSVPDESSEIKEKKKLEEMDLGELGAAFMKS